MDELDKKILAQLQQNNRISTEELGQTVGLSATACQRRLKRLRSSGVIEKEVAVLNAEHVGDFVTVIVEVFIKEGSAKIIDDFKRRMLTEPCVQQCFYMAGNVDFIIVVTAKNMQEYEKLTRRLFFQDDNIKKYHSMVTMDKVKVGLDIPI